MKKRLWIFYYTTKEQQYKKFEFARLEFKKPNQSKVWKELQKLLLTTNMDQIGYQTAKTFLAEL